MTPRAEAMVVWKCLECGFAMSDPDGICGHSEGERIEVVPVADYERALDALEVAWPYVRKLGDWRVVRVVRALLRAAGRLDG